MVNPGLQLLPGDLGSMCCCSAPSPLASNTASIHHRRGSSYLWHQPGQHRAPICFPGRNQETPAAFQHGGAGGFAVGGLACLVWLQAGLSGH